MTELPLREIWMDVLVRRRDPHLTVEGDVALFAKGAEAQLRIGLFKNLGEKTAASPGEFYSVGNIVAFIAKLWATSYGTGTLLLDTSSAAHIAACAAVGKLPVEFDATVTEAQFLARERAPITLYLPASVTANVTAGIQFGVFTGATNERPTQPDWFGNFKCESLEVGLSTVAVAPAPAELYVRADMFQAADANNVKFGKNKAGRTATFVSRNGTRGRTIGCDDAGKPIDSLERYS